MRCHYEVLAVARDASAVEIKKAFRLQALRWHPDKHQRNGISSEEATEQFQTIQNAYEVLSDPHEKKWYDEHREQILRGGDGNDDDEDEEADELNLFRYFSASVYSGFGSDDKSFYSVYGKLFAKIDEVDIEGGDGSRTDAAPGLGNAKTSMDAAPGLGNAKTSMDDVNDFYQHWKSYTTQRSFAWVDEYKTTDAPTRMVRRAMEKENKKLRDAEKKAFTTEVRELVDFVCRRDPRVQAIQKQKEKEKEQRRVKDEAKRREKQAAFDAEKRAFQEQQQKLWADSETSRVADRHIEQELEKLRKKMDADVLVCDSCNKTFKSTKQLQNHMTSKKHREKEEELGVFSDLSVLDDEMDRALQEELIALGKVKRGEGEEDNTPSKQSEEDDQQDADEVDLEQQQADEDAALKKAEAERVRLEKEEKAAEKRRERKEMRKNKKKENVEKIVSSARSKKEQNEEEEEQRGRGKKGKKRR